MSDLKVSDEAVAGLRSTFSSMTKKLEEVLSRLRHQDSEVLGAAPLVDKSQDFGASWRYGIGQLGSHAHECDELLRKVLTKFGQLDEELGNALAKASAQKGHH